MRGHSILFNIWIMFCLCLFACSSQTSAVKKNDQNQKVANVIALMPLDSSDADVRVSKMLRTKLDNELRFKGYPSIATDLIDSKLMPLASGKELKNYDAIPPSTVEELVGADAAMYCSLQHSKISKSFFYSPVTVSVRCELRSAKTGEKIWDAQYKTTNRSFDLIWTRLEMKSQGDLEASLEEVVGKVMETLPYGPKLRG
ncbi:MAG: GNA1162 family protein [Smithella sp.]|jgi:hypothetical protein